MSLNLDRLTEWDTKEEYTGEVPDWSYALSPQVIITRTLRGEEVEETPPARQNRRLISERFLKPGVAPPCECTPEVEAGKTPQTKDVPARAIRSKPASYQKMKLWNSTQGQKNSSLL